MKKLLLVILFFSRIVFAGGNSLAEIQKMLDNTSDENAREEAFDLMLSHAKDAGGNAVVGVRYDTGPMVGTAEVLCYGTAVIVEPVAT